MTSWSWHVRSDLKPEICRCLSVLRPLTIARCWPEQSKYRRDVCDGLTTYDVDRLRRVVPGRADSNGRAKSARSCAGGGRCALHDKRNIVQIRHLPC